MNVRIKPDDYEYVKSLAEPFVDTPESVISRIIQEHRDYMKTNSESDPSYPPKKASPPVYRSSALPPLKHTKPIAASIADTTILRPSWKSLLDAAIIASHKKGHTPEEIVKVLPANATVGERHGPGFGYLKDAGISYQGLEAARCGEAIVTLARAFSIPIEIDFTWRDKEDAHQPGQQGTILHP